jgi:hypothetical protein
MHFRAASFSFMLMLAAGPASADLIFDLTMTSESAIPDGPSYGTVKIEALDLDSVRFTIDPNEAILGAGPNFGVQDFGFNFDAEAAGSLSFDGLPEDWNTGTDKNVSRFGRFDYLLSGDGSSRQDLLVFTVNTTNLFADEGSLEEAFYEENGKDFHFTAHIADFTEFEGPESAHFGDGGGNPVPEPSTLILLGSSIAALALVRKKKRA